MVARDEPIGCLTYPQSACGHVGDVMRSDSFAVEFLVLLQLAPKFGGPSFLYRRGAHVVSPRGRTEIAMHGNISSKLH